MDQEKMTPLVRKSDTPVGEEMTTSMPFTLAAPSFVIPAGAADNAYFLEPYFAEIALLFFETEACLAYTEKDLPADLAHLDVSWHVHLPLDLPWEAGMGTVWEKLTGLMKKVAYLSPRTWVLHPPTKPGLLIDLAERCRAAGINPQDVLLENVEEADLCPLWDEILTAGFSTCLDLGHIIAYNQHPVLELPEIWKTARMLHIYAPGKKGRHTGLAELDGRGQDILRHMIESFTGDTVTLEVFAEKPLFRSMELFAQWHTQWSEKK
jgi:hypothetical protein